MIYDACRINKWVGGRGGGGGCGTVPQLKECTNLKHRNVVVPVTVAVEKVK